MFLFHNLKHFISSHQVFIEDFFFLLLSCVQVVGLSHQKYKLFLVFIKNSLFYIMQKYTNKNCTAGEMGKWAIYLEKSQDLVILAFPSLISAAMIFVLYSSETSPAGLISISVDFLGFS